MVLRLIGLILSGPIFRMAVRVGIEGTVDGTLMIVNGLNIVLVVVAVVQLRMAHMVGGVVFVLVVRFLVDVVAGLVARDLMGVGCVTRFFVMRSSNTLAVFIRGLVNHAFVIVLGIEGVIDGVLVEVNRLHIVLMVVHVI